MTRKLFFGAGAAAIILAMACATGLFAADANAEDGDPRDLIQWKAGATPAQIDKAH
jgi:hypothetical protein